MNRVGKSGHGDRFFDQLENARFAEVFSIEGGSRVLN